MSDYTGKNIPEKKVDMKKKKTSDLYMKDGVPCGDIEATGTRGKGPTGNGSGPKVGGYPMGASNAFAKGVPNAGREDITAEVMKPEHKANVKDSVLNTKEDPKWGGVIKPTDMGVHNTIGVK